MHLKGKHTICKLDMPAFTSLVPLSSLFSPHANGMQDPYANAYTHTWRERDAWSPSHRRIGRGGWVATRNYELDSGAYFLNMLWNYYTTPGLFAAERCTPLTLHSLNLSESHKCPWYILFLQLLQHF